jgi:CubicO group peptidase (beta-lactamase class C family)
MRFVLFLFYPFPSQPSTTFYNAQLVWHTGGVPGGSTIIAFLPNDGIGVTALVNADSKDVLVFPLVLRIVEHLLGLEQIDWVSR